MLKRDALPAVAASLAASGCGRAGRHAAEDLLLARPDHEPDVEPHDDAQQHAEQDPAGADADAALGAIEEQPLDEYL